MSKIKLILSIISANLYLPLLVICYRIGGPFELVIFNFALLHIVLFAIISDKIRHHILLSLNITISYCAGSGLSTWFYYNNISNDDMTPVVGAAIVFWGAIILCVLTVVSAVIKHTRQKTSE